MFQVHTQGSIIYRETKEILPAHFLHVYVNFLLEIKLPTKHVNDFFFLMLYELNCGNEQRIKLNGQF